MERVFGYITSAALVLSVGAFSARADTFDVSLNTSPLSGTQFLVFGLTDGDGAANNTVALSDFTFGGGGAVVPPFASGGVNGDLVSDVTLDDSTFSSLFAQQFNPGTSLSFLLTTTNNLAGGTPDEFVMQLCNATFSVCYSDDPLTGAMLVLDLTGAALSPSSFVLNGATDQSLNAPVVALQTSTVPEPTSLFLLCIVLALTAVLWRSPDRTKIKR
jgi:hypothetical protein